jgi:DNA replication protein DnaC
LLRLAELELIERERRTVKRRIKGARFPTVKSLHSFDFTALPSLNKAVVLELARCEDIARRENVIAVGKQRHWQNPYLARTRAGGLPDGLIGRLYKRSRPGPRTDRGRDDKRLLRLQRQLAAYKLLIIDELAYVPRSTTSAESPVRGP